VFYRNQVEDSGSVSLLIIKPGLFTAARSKASEIIERLMSSPPSQSGGPWLGTPARRLGPHLPGTLGPRAIDFRPVRIRFRSSSSDGSAHWNRDLAGSLAAR